MPLGTAAPFNILDNGRYLATGYSDGKHQNFILRSELEASGGIFGMGAHDADARRSRARAPIVWALGRATSSSPAILTPDEPGAGSSPAGSSSLTDAARHGHPTPTGCRPTS